MDELLEFLSEPWQFGPHSFGARFFFVHQRRQKRGDFDGSHIVEEASEDKIRQQYFVVGIDFAGDPSLQSNHALVHEPDSLDDSIVGLHLCGKDQGRL